MNRFQANRARPKDLRLYIGLAIVVIAMLGTFWLVTSNNSKSLALALTADVILGEPVSVDQFDLVEVNIAELDGDYLTEIDPSSTLFWQRNLGAGELIPASAVGTDNLKNFVSIQFIPMLSPAGDISFGDAVDIWLVPAADGTTQAVPTVLVHSGYLTKMIPNSSPIKTQADPVEILVPRSKVGTLLLAIESEIPLAIIKSGWL